MGDWLVTLAVLETESLVAISLSVLGLTVSLVGYLRIRTVSKAIHRDRELMEDVLEFPEIQYHLEKAFHFLALSRAAETSEPEAQEALRDGLQRAYYLIGSFHRQYLGRRAVGNPYLCAARRYQKRGAVRDAIFFYERALESSLALGSALSRDETVQCLGGLQRCQFMCFDREGAMSVARRAREMKAAEGCRPEEEVRKRGWIFCLGGYVELLWRRLRYPAWSRVRSYPIFKKHD